MITETTTLWLDPQNAIHIGAWFCCNVECATEVERRMGEFGYNIRKGGKVGNVSNIDSCYVYILKKGKCTTDNV